MAANKPARSSRNTAKTPETSLRHFWLAGLGVAAIARRRSRHALDRIALLRQQAQGNVCEGIAGIREQGLARAGQFSAEVEARLAPVLAKLGMKPEPRVRVRKPAKKTARARRRATGPVKKAMSRQAVGKRR